jgi:hypothetical protein
MNRLLSYWLSPIAAALLAGFVATTLAVAWWARVPATTSAPTPLLSENVNVFPAVAALPVTTTPSTIPVMGDFALLGTVLPRGRENARAALRINGRPFVFDEGQEIVPGLRLEKVFARSVKLSSKEGARELDMAAIKNAPPAPPVRAVSASATNPSRVTLAAGCNATPAQKRDGIILGSELLAGALQNPTGLTSLLNPASGKLVVQNSAGIGALIGLRDGDVLRSIDGKPILQAAELVARLLQPVSQAQAVIVEINRDAAPQVLTFLPPGCRG